MSSGRTRFVLIVSLLLSLTSEAQGDEKPRTAPVADAERIGRLIRALGSDRFEERESASRDLERIGVPALAALQKAGRAYPDAEVRRRAAELSARIENGLDQLLADYRFFGLPLPPDRVSLVRFEERPSFRIVGVSTDGKERTITVPPTYSLGFMLESAAKDHAAKLLHGTETRCCEAKQVSPALDPHRLTASDIEADQFNPSTALVFALQMHARGWTIAETLLQKGFKEEDNRTPRMALRRLAWDYWKDRLQDPAADYWPAACQQMKALLAAERKLDTPENRHLLKSLEAALVPSKARVGSMNALIDDLINVRGVGYRSEPDDARYRRVFDLGFDAVPALIEHLDDDRLTHYQKPPSSIGILPDEEYTCRVRDLAVQLLRSIAGEQSTRHWASDRNGAVGKTRDIKAWWDEARKEGEEAYLLSHVLPPPGIYDPRDGRDLSPFAFSPDFNILRLLAKKYPRRLPRLYRTVLETQPYTEIWPLTEAIVGSSLPHEEKVELLVLGAANKSPKHRKAAMWELKKLDGDRFVTALVATLDGLPRTPENLDLNYDPEDFAWLVSVSDDARAWRALEGVALRVDPCLRMDILKNTANSSATPAQRRLRLAFLAAFLNDDNVRDVIANKELFDSINSGTLLPSMEVRNVAAMQIAELRGTPVDPTPDWDIATWAILRIRMGVVAKYELARQSRGK